MLRNGSLHHGALKFEVLRWFIAHDGAGKWDVEKAFPDRRGVPMVLSRLVQSGHLRQEEEPHGVSVWIRYYRTGKQLGPQQKLEIFVEVEA